MSALEVEEPKKISTFQLSYQNKTCSNILNVQNVNRMSGRQNDMPKDRQTDRQTERQIEDKTTFQLSYQNKTCL